MFEWQKYFAGERACILELERNRQCDGFVVRTVVISRGTASRIINFASARPANDKPR